jgi:hypothetical protein
LQRKDGEFFDDQRSVIRVRETLLIADKLIGYKFDTIFLSALNSQIFVNNSAFFDSDGEQHRGVAISAEESYLNVTRSNFYNMSANLGAAILFSQSDYSPQKKILNVT